MSHHKVVRSFSSRLLPTQLERLSRDRRSSEPRAIAPRRPVDSFEPSRLTLSAQTSAGKGPEALAYDGSVPALGTTGTNAAQPVNAPEQGDPNARDAATYDNVLNQFAVGVNLRYTPRDSSGDGQTDTFCNIFVWDATRAMGAEIPHWIDGAGNPVAPGAGWETDANANNQWLNGKGKELGWREVSAEEAQALANQGHPAVASWNNPNGIGHIAMVRPGEITSGGPAIAQAGGTNFNQGHVRDGFGGRQPQYFVNDSGKVASTEPEKPWGDPAITELVSATYREVLRREPDPGGLNNWNGPAQAMAAEGKSPEQIKTWLNAQFAGSTEAQALKLVDQTFVEVLGRDVSSSRGYWHEKTVELMRDGGKSAEETKAFLVGNLQRSTEYGLAHVDEVVTKTFEEVLGRTPDVNDYWHGVGRQLVTDGKSLEEVGAFMRAQFLSSEEYRINHPDEAIVRDLYGSLLGREPDPEGLKTWTKVAADLRAGGADDPAITAELTTAIKASAEYQLRSPAPVTSVELPKTGNAFLDGLADEAIASQRQTGVPASLTLAQAMLESGSGASTLASEHNNYFGVKGSGTGGSVSMLTTEYGPNGAYQTMADFAVYNTVEDSFNAHGVLINGSNPNWTPYYAQPWARYQQDGDAIGLARGIAGIYATDPAYAQKIVGIMERYDLTRLDALA